MPLNVIREGDHRALIASLRESGRRDSERRGRALFVASVSLFQYIYVVAFATSSFLTQGKPKMAIILNHSFRTNEKLE